MPIVMVNDQFETALRRFKRACEKSGVYAVVRRKEFYEKPTALRKRKKAAARKRHLKRLQRERYLFEKQPKFRQIAALAESQVHNDTAKVVEMQVVGNASE